MNGKYTISTTGELILVQVGGTSRADEVLTLVGGIEGASSLNRFAGEWTGSIVLQCSVDCSDAVVSLLEGEGLTPSAEHPS